MRTLMTMAALLVAGATQAQSVPQPDPAPAPTPVPTPAPAPTPAAPGKSSIARKTPPVPGAAPVAPVAPTAPSAPSALVAPVAPIAPMLSDEDRAELDAARHRAKRVPTEEESLALSAMEGLMSQPADRALPIIRRVLTGNQTTLVKERALFVLSQIDKPEAQSIMLDIARDNKSALRGEAIRSIGISGNSNMLGALKDIYRSGDDLTKRHVLQAWLISGRKNEVYQAALDAQSEGEANRAIRALSVMGATEELRKLGERRKHNRSLLEAYAIAGDLASLRKIVDGNGDTALRAEAVARIGIIHTDAARTALREIYAGAAQKDIRDAALNGMLISHDEQGVLALYRAAKTTDEKRSLLRTLSHMGGDAALQAIDAALDGKK
jgi:hypothetical protein